MVSTGQDPAPREPAPVTEQDKREQRLYRLRVLGSLFRMAYYVVRIILTIR